MRPLVYSALLLIVVLSSFSVNAYQREQVFSISDPRASARESDQSPAPRSCSPDLRTRNNERLFKANMISARIRDPKKFEQERKNNLENQPLYQSWMDEVAEALKGKSVPAREAHLSNDELYRKYYEGTPMDLAHKIAKRQMFMMIHGNWTWLKNSIYNDVDAQSWCPPEKIERPRADSPMADPDEPFGYRVTSDRMLDYFLFSPRYDRADTYVFTFEMGGPNFVELKRTLRSGRSGVDVSSLHDSNRLEDGASKIKSDDSNSSPNGEL